MVEWNDSKKYGALFGGALIGSALILATIVFPFWNLIREDVKEEVEILSNSNGVCYANTADNIPKQIKNCDLDAGTKVTIKFGEGLAWAEVVEP